MRSKVRLLCVKLAATGEYTGEEVAKICGKSQSCIFLWFRLFVSGALRGFWAGKSRGLERVHFAGYPLPSWSN